MAEAVKRSQTEIVTVSLRRETAGGRNGGAFFEMIRELGVRVLPNTAGCHGVSEAVLTAKMAREVFRTNWIKLEVIGSHDTLQPDVFALVEAAKLLTDEGFEVFPYMTDDLIVAERLLEAGCKVLMPWCAPIGTAAGPLNLSALRSMRAHFPDVPLIVDAGIGRPSHAATVMELGFDAVLLNTAVAGAGDPAAMAEAFAKAIDAGRQAYRAGPLEPRDMAVPSTPVIGKAVFA
jgi:thiazole synthase